MTQPRTFRAATMALALAEVKKDLGPDAVILSTRSVRAGGFAGVGAKPVVEITATPAAMSPSRPRSAVMSMDARTGPASPRTGSAAPAGATPTTIRPGPPVTPSQPRPGSLASASAAGAKPANAALLAELMRASKIPAATPAATKHAVTASAATPSGATTPAGLAAAGTVVHSAVSSPASGRRDRDWSVDADEEWTPASFESAIASLAPQGEPARDARGMAPVKRALAVAPPAVDPGGPRSCASSSASVVARAPELTPPPDAPSLETLSMSTPGAASACPRPAAAAPASLETPPSGRTTVAPESVDAAPPFGEPASSPAVGASVEHAAAPIADRPATAQATPQVPGPRLIDGPVLEPKAAAALAGDLTAIRRMMMQVLRASHGAGTASAAGLAGFEDAYAALLESGVNPDLAGEALATARGILADAATGDEAVIADAALRGLAQLLPVDAALAAPGPQADGRPLTLALVGPTGVGKTTTIAKLAALYKLRYDRRVGLITTDTYRIAAVEQLRTYARIIGLPLCVAADAEEMADATRQLADCDVILIDTAGRSPADDARLDELAACIAAACPHETHLVMQATSTEAALTRIAERFARLRPDRLILTKFDEADAPGAIAAVPARAALPVSFVTTGQEVPEDIRRADAAGLARLLAPKLAAMAPQTAEAASE